MDSKKTRLLLVEDDPEDAELLLETLSEAAPDKFETLLAESLAGALERLEKEDVDVILLDLGLPDSMGMDTLLTANRLVSKTPIIVLTGLDDEDFGARAVQQGAQDYLVKGKFQGDLLVRTLRYAIQRKGAEVALRQERDRAQGYLDIAGVMFLVIGSDGRVSMVNRKGCEILGCSEDEIVGKNWFQSFLPEHLRTSVEGVFHQMMSGELKSVEYYENSLLTSSGEERLIAWHNTIIRDGAGNITGTLSSGEDITEKKRNEIMIRETNARLKAIIESPQDIIIFSLDREYNYTAFNENHKQEIKKVFNVDIQAGMSLFDIMKVIPEARTAAVSSFDRALAGESFSEVQVQPGHGIYYEFFWNPILDEGGEVIGLTCFVQDITERKKGEEILRESKAQWEATFNAISDWVALIDLEGMILRTNQAGESFTGVPWEEIVGKTCYQLVHDRDGPIPECPFPRMLKSRQRESSEIQVPGLELWWQVTVDPILSEDGVVSGAVHIVQDITERKKAEAVATRLGSIMDRALNEIFIFDAETMRFIQVNQGARENLGFSMEELREMTPLDIKPEFTADSFGEQVAPLLDASKPRIHFSTVHQRKDDSQYPVDIHLQMIDFEGKPAFLAIILDVTEKQKIEENMKQLQAQLLHKQKLASIGTLASGVAHEINNPLMGVLGYAQLINDRIEDKEIREFSQGIMDESQRMAAIVRNLLSFARQDSANYSLAAISDVVDASIGLLDVVIRKDDITLERDIQASLPFISCRSQQLQQVVVNLLTNARDALNERYPGYHENKCITVFVGMVQKNGDSWLRTTVEDHGSGISEEDLQRIFDPFFTIKARDTTTGRFGTGLGLSVSYGIVEEHGGRLWAESIPGEYTRFHMDLPVTEAREEEGGNEDLDMCVNEQGAPKGENGRCEK